MIKIQEVLLVSPRKVITSMNLVLAKFRHWLYSSLEFIYLKAPQRISSDSRTDNLM